MTSLQAEISRCRKKMYRVNSNLRTLEVRREALRKAVGNQLFHRVVRLVVGGRQPALSPVVGGACNECSIAVPAQAEIDVRNGELITCFNCGRLLYWPDEEDPDA